VRADGSGGRAARGSPAARGTDTRRLARTLLCATALTVAACETSSHRLIGAARPAIPVERVQLYLERPARRYLEIATLDASSERAWAFGEESKAQVVIRRLKAEAAKIGANGVLLEGISEAAGPAVGADIGTNYEGPRGTIDLGLGAGTLFGSRRGSGIAIYLEPE
jgi:hypothetical protein